MVTQDEEDFVLFVLLILAWVLVWVAVVQVISLYL